jgi:hypothetical protein
MISTGSVMIRIKANRRTNQKLGRIATCIKTPMDIAMETINE